MRRRNEMHFERLSRRGILRLVALGGVAGGALGSLMPSRPAIASSGSFHPAVGSWENLAPRVDVPNESYHNQFAFLVGGIAIFNSPPMDIEPGDDEQYSGPFFGVWEADGPTSIAFGVRHGLYDATVLVNGFEDMWGTATLSADGASLEVTRTFSETDANGGEKYRTTRTATFTRQTLRRGPSGRSPIVPAPSA
jgi:hypothetical protein